MEIAYCSDIGLVRPNNEDSFLVVPPWTEPALSHEACFFGVADGMGGHASGEVASKLALDTMRQWLTELPSKEISLNSVETAFSDANGAIFSMAKEKNDLNGMGTTLTAMIISGKQAFVGHVGDTRAYLLRGGELQQITRDHTLVAEQIRLGNLTVEQAKKHPARHILSRAMGVREYVNVDTSTVDLMPGDIFFMCSDGVYGQVPEDRMKQLFLETPFPRVAKLLVAEANQAGGQDNSTIVTFKVQELPVAFPPPYSLDRIRSMWQDWWNR